MKRLATVVAASAVGLILAVLGPGFYQCILRTGTCGEQLIGCAATVLTPNVQAALLTVGLGGLIAWLYQRANKVMEFRFETYKEMTSNITDCFLEAIRLREPVRLLQDLSSGGGRTMDTPLATEAAGQIKTGKKRLEDLANVGVAMHLRIGSLFKESVSTPWLKMNKFFRDYSLDPITKDFSLINDAMKEAATACEAACREVGLPFKPTEYVAGLAVKQTGKEPTK